jgi:hypothetical protein
MARIFKPLPPKHYERWSPGMYVTNLDMRLSVKADSPEFRNVVQPTFTAIAQAMARADKITQQRKESK